MPAETVVVLTVVISMFAVFMVALGGVWIWTNLPPRQARRPALGQAASSSDRLPAR
jgi:hypothetical protein